jgi:hypothetical protein
MGTLSVIETEIIPDTGPGISSIVIGFEIHLLL